MTETTTKTIEETVEPTTETTSVRASLYEPAPPTPDDLIDQVVLPTGEVIEDGQQFTWKRTRYEIRVHGQELHFIKDPNMPQRDFTGPERVEWLDFDSHDEFREWCVEEQNHLEFHKPNPSIVRAVVSRLTDFFRS